MIRPHHTLVLIAPLMLTVASADGAFVTLEDFNSRSAGTLTETGNVEDVFVPNNTGLTVNQDSGNLFGEGTSNNYLAITDDSDGGGPFALISDGSVFDTAGTGTDDDQYSIALDFIDNSTAGGRVNLRGRDGGSSSNEGFDPRLTAGNLDPGDDTYSTGTLYTLQVNVTDEAAGTYDVYVADGTTVVASELGLNFRDNGSDNLLDSVSLQSFTGDTGTNVLIDNVRVSGDLIPIPEPASLALLAVGGVMILPRRRRQAGAAA
jgi:hypothetical protein